MDEWTGIRQERYLRAIIARDSPNRTEECRSCSEQFSHWRCRDCLGNQALCRRCCRERHRDLPCHRIEFWTGTHYERDWLCNLGVVVHLGHHSRPCPVRDPVQLSEEPQPFTENWEIYGSPSGLADKPLDCNLLTVADNNGVHRVWFRPCSCREGGEEYDFLELGLYPASYTRVETVFTFDLLQNCHVDNLECKTSVYHLWSKLTQLTCSFFSAGVPVSGILCFVKICISHPGRFISQNRHQELFRVLRQWRNLKQQKWSGQPYNEAPSGSPGSLALFCGACPQPGLNLPEDWQRDPDPDAYVRTFTMDGNFSAVHQKRMNARPEQCLTNGELYMVNETRYRAHMSSAIETKEVRADSHVWDTFISATTQPMTCNEHHALKDRFIAHKAWMSQSSTLYGHISTRLISWTDRL